MAVEIAEAVAGALQGELSATAVNAPMVPKEVNFVALDLLLNMVDFFCYPDISLAYNLLF